MLRVRSAQNQFVTQLLVQSFHIPTTTSYSPFLLREITTKPTFSPTLTTVICPHATALTLYHSLFILSFYYIPSFIKLVNLFEVNQISSHINHPRLTNSYNTKSKTSICRTITSQCLRNARTFLAMGCIHRRNTKALISTSSTTSIQMLCQGVRAGVEGWMRILTSATSYVSFSGLIQTARSTACASLKAQLVVASSITGDKSCKPRHPMIS